MKRVTAAVLLFLSAIVVTAQTPSAQSPQPLTGRWLLTSDFFSTTRYFRLDLEQNAQQLTSTFNGTKLQGTITGSHLALTGTGSDGGTSTFDATVQSNTFTGTLTFTYPNDSPTVFKFVATSIPPLQSTAPQRHEFVPTVFYRQFSPFNKPVLTIAPGDTVHTTTVDAGGADKDSVKRSAGGNPQTGPFYIQGAMPGDTLIVHLNRLRLNRDWAGSDDSIVQSALSPDLAIKTRDNGKSIRWHLDLANNTTTPDPASNPNSDHFKTLAVPLHPMLGCIATATGPAGAPPPTGDSGNWGGNLDFNEIAEGATIYLPVSNPGALLYVGDGHALQGDGEINGNALETSMDVEFTVDLIPGKRLSSVRVETPQTIIALGYSGSLDDAFRDATSNMAQWLTDDYKLNPSEIAQFIGVAAQYKVTEVADRNSGVALKINKSILQTLTKAK
jgi:acetamidase/formamidase